MSNEPLILDRVTRSNVVGDGRLVVLDNVSLRQAANSWLVVFGPSGSGKTTLFRLLLGLIRPDSGEILVGGDRLSSIKDRDLPEFRIRHLGLVLGRDNLLPSLTALENVELPLSLCKVGAAERRRRALVALESVGEIDLAATLAYRLLPLQAQLVALARAVVTTPTLVLMDEPTAILDADRTAIFIQRVQAVQRASRLAMLWLTHNAAVTHAAPRVVRLNRGQFE